MPLGPKTRRYLAMKRDPSGSVSAFMESMEATAEAIALDTVEKVVGKHSAELKKTLDKETKKELDKLPARTKELEAEFRRMVRAKIESLPQIKGAPGAPGDPGDDGRTPVEDVDYLSRASSMSYVATLVTAAFERMKKEGMTRKAMEKAIEEAFVPRKIARSLEALAPAEKLDYHRGLKNQPSEVTDSKKHTLHRGTSSSKQTYYYDLSGFCDGGTKSFAIPSNTRVIAVSGTDAPGGIYRPLVDWTGTGTTTLTLTAQVATPQTGATLYILYVV